ncbi:hypothetical protein ACNKHR_07335 [Shigella flexneri]
MLIDEVRAGGRIPLIIGRGLTTKAREALGLRTVMCSVRRKMSLRAIAASRWRKKW